MVKLYIIIFLIFSTFVHADELKVIANANSISIGDSFTISFEITTNSNSTPFISFDPGRAKVLGKRNAGTVSQTTMINGQIKTSRKIIYEYELTAERQGIIRISDINVSVDDKNLKHKDIKVNVLRETQAPKNIFLLAIPEKENVYVGEGINVRYYLYYRYSSVQSEIKEYPKFRKFLKRFKMPKESPETVKYNGILYNRVLKYSVKVFPQAKGKIALGKLRLIVRYMDRRRNNRFGGFNFSIQTGYKTKTISSKSTFLNVSEIPLNNLPSTYTGLVGKHDFKFSINKNKYLTNEVVEAKLEVTGPGALEKMEAPVFYSNEDLESFDVKTEIVEINPQNSKKTFEYTYLGRKPIEVLSSQKTFSYFDPNTKSFKDIEIDIPQLSIVGSALPVAAANSKPRKESTDEASDVAPTLKLNAPIWTLKEGKLKLFDLKNIYVGLLIVFVLLLLDTLRFGLEYKFRASDSYLLLKEIEKKGADYSDIYQLITSLSETPASTLNEFFDNIELPDEDKKLLRSAVEKVEQTDYSKSYGNQRTKLPRKLIRNIRKIIKHYHYDQSK